MALYHVMPKSKSLTALTVRSSESIIAALTAAVRCRSPLLSVSLCSSHSHIHSLSVPPGTTERANGNCETLSTLSKDEDAVDRFNNVPINNHVLHNPRLQQKVSSIMQSKLEHPAVTTLTHLVKYSANLQMLVSMGVSLSRIEKFVGAPDLLASIDNNRNIHDVVNLLNQLGISDVGSIINKCPYILGENSNVLKKRIMYLHMRKFSKEQLSDIISKHPQWFCEEVDIVDGRLGAIKQMFYLTGAEIRTLTAQCPKLILWDPVFIQEAFYNLKEVYSFTKEEIKTMLLSCPAAYLTSKHSLGRRLSQLLDSMKVERSLIVMWPLVLRTSEKKLHERHEVLAQLNLAQYKSDEPGFISLQNLVTGTDERFCAEVARIPIETYYELLKTL